MKRPKGALTEARRDLVDGLTCRSALSPSTLRAVDLAMRLEFTACSESGCRIATLELSVPRGVARDGRTFEVSSESSEDA
jgi:hypothetical protein